MTLTDDHMVRLLTSATDLPGTSLGIKILMSRLRVEVRAQPSSLAAKRAELTAFLHKNPDAAAELAQC